MRSSAVPAELHLVEPVLQVAAVHNLAASAVLAVADNLFEVVLHKQVHPAVHNLAALAEHITVRKPVPAVAVSEVVHSQDEQEFCYF